MDEALETAPPLDAEGSYRVAYGALEGLLAFRLGRVWAHMWRNHAVVMAQWELKPGSFTALGLIAANPGFSQNALAREMGADAPSIVAVMDDLERRGWAIRTRSTTDRRRHVLRATQAGEAALRHLSEAARNNEATIAAEFSEEEWRRIFDCLDRMYRRLVSAPCA